MGMLMLSLVILNTCTTVPLKKLLFCNTEIIPFAKYFILFAHVFVISGTLLYGCIKF